MNAPLRTNLAGAHSRPRRAAALRRLAGLAARHGASRNRRRATAAGVVGALAASGLVGLGVAASPALAADASVTVSSTSAGPLLTQLSTNNVWSGMLDGSSAALSNFRALKAPLVRIHVGDDGSPVAMPEVKQGAWSFAALDTLVNDSTKAGGDVVMNIKFAPDWMWTCSTYQASGTVRDLTFQTYAAYMARLVSYYNKGSMTTESGQVITNPAGTSNRIVNWEPWNEPDLNNETPCAPPSGVGLTSAQYVTMWNAVVPKMLAVDPTLRFVGPATAGGQFGSGGADDYVTALMNGAQVKPSALSFHGYGYWDNSVPDKWLFDGDGTSGGGGIKLISDTSAAVHAAYPTMPIWVTEVNVNSAWGNDPYSRPWTALGAAWWGSMFSQLAPRGAGMIHQYEVMESPQFGLLNDQTGAPGLPYWTFKALNAGFPAGSTMLTSSSTNAGVQTLAAKRADGTISVLVVNRQLNGATTKGGAGLPALVSVALPGVTPTAVSETQIDANTPVATGPATVSLDPTAPLTVNLPGYGFAVLTITPNGTTPVPSPTATTASPTPSPTATTASPTPSPVPSPIATTVSPTPSPTATTASPVLPAGAPAPMQLISKGARAYANNTCSGSYPASNANDSNYDTVWMACGTPSTTSPRRLTYDLSKVSSTLRGKALVSWYNDPMTSEYNHKLTGGPGYNNVGSYTLQVNAAPGGTQPTSGWVTVASVTGNTYHSRQHLIDLTGYNWLRMQVTASDGSSGNNGIGINMDVQSAAGGASDAWMFYGDSITQDGMSHDSRVAASGASVGTFAQLVNASRLTYFPAFENGGTGGLASADGAANIGTWLPMFSGRYVSLAFGTNDALSASAGDPTIATPYHDNMAAMVKAVLAAGKVPVVPTIPWGRTASLKTNVPVLNNVIAQLRTEFPQIVAGPDLYAFYNSNQSLISSDGVHPSWNAGYAALRQVWAGWAVSNIYG